MNTKHWLGPASRWSCLISSLFAILLSSSQTFIFTVIKLSPRPPQLSEEIAMICLVHRQKANIRWNMVFVWQAPMMLLACSVLTFIIGLCIYIATPLYADDVSLGGRPVCSTWQTPHLQFSDMNTGSHILHDLVRGFCSRFHVGLQARKAWFTLRSSIFRHGGRFMPA